MRISWLESDVIRRVRGHLVARHPDWAVHFLPEFKAPPAPPGMDKERWAQIAEHVARAERVGQEIRQRGLDATMAQFVDSGHAVELATLIAAATQVEQLSYELIAALLACPVDELIAYGTFLEFFHDYGKSRADEAIAVYERFCAAFEAKQSDQAMWSERVATVRDGLAGFYAHCGRHEQAHALFLRRHQEETHSLLVALTASRTFLSAGAVSQAVSWLGLGAERAAALGRPSMADKLRQKQESVRKRQS